MVATHSSPTNRRSGSAGLPLASTISASPQAMTVLCNGSIRPWSLRFL